MLFLVVAVCLHAPLLAIPTSWLFSKPRATSTKKRVVYIHRFSRFRSQRRRMVIRKMRRKKLQKLRFKPPKKRKKKKKKKEPIKPKGQIVDVAPTPDDRAPKKARFLSEYNTRVKKQSVSRHRKLKYKVAAPKLLRKKKANPRKRKALLASRIFAIRSPFKYPRMTRPSVKKKQKKQQTRKKRKVRKQRRLRLPRLRRQKKLALPKRKKGQYRSRKKQMAIRGKHKRLALQTGPPLRLDPSLKPMFRKGKGPRVPPRVVDLRPNYGTLSRISGAPAPDHIKGVAEGDATLLNSRRYIYASFFNRIKRQVAQHWNPSGVYRRRDPYGNVYGVRDRATVVAVVLTKGGKLTKVSVKRSSGLSFLDREALRAFRAANPFPNPPKALVGRDGKIRFSFNFFLQISSRRGFRLFR